MDWTPESQASLSFTISWKLLRLMSIESVMPSNHLFLCHPLLLLPSIMPSIRIFSDELDLRIGCPKYWSFRFSISPSNEYSGLISFRVDWFDLLAVQGTLKSLLQHHHSKAFSTIGTFYLGLLKQKHLNTSVDILMEYEVGRNHLTTGIDLNDDWFPSLAIKHSTLVFRSLPLCFYGTISLQPRVEFYHNLCHS